MEAVQEVMSNKDILEHILQYLSLEQQVECVAICETFWYVIVKRLWKKRYRKLNIFKTPYISVITNGIENHTMGVENPLEKRLERLQEFKEAIKYDKCNVFLINIAKSVRELRVYSEYFTFQQSLGVAFKNIQIFKNLISLSYNQMVVTDEQLELIARTCTKLQRLEFIECSCGDLKPLVPGVNLEVRNFARMPQLKELKLEAEPMTPAPEIECDIIYEILSNLKLKLLVIKNILTTDSDADTVKLANGLDLRVLHTGYISLDFWPDFKHHLKDFGNLTELTINVLDCNTLINGSVLEILQINCQKLQKLSFENCDFYVEDFAILKTIQHLTLMSCGGFTASNLQQVLGSLPLVSLSMLNTRVLGVIDDIYVSPALEVLTVDTIYYTSISEAFRKALNPMTNLHTIKWLNGKITDSWIVDKCPNLKVLHIPNPHLLRCHILKMTTLEELTFTSCKGYSWCFLLILMRNLPLKRMNIYTNEVINDNKEIPQNACEVRTTIQKIVMPYRLFKTAQDFWMDLLNLNRNLKMVFYGDYVDLLSANFVRGLLRYEYVRDHLKSVKLCGFPIDVEDLKTKFDETIYLMNTNTSHYRARNSKFTLEL